MTFRTCLLFVFSCLVRSAFTSWQLQLHTLRKMGKELILDTWRSIWVPFFSPLNAVFHLSCMKSKILIYIKLISKSMTMNFYWIAWSTMLRRNQPTSKCQNAFENHFLWRRQIVESVHVFSIHTSLSIGKCGTLGIAINVYSLRVFGIAVRPQSSIKYVNQGKIVILSPMLGLWEMSGD